MSDSCSQSDKPTLSVSERVEAQRARVRQVFEEAKIPFPEAPETWYSFSQWADHGNFGNVSF